MCLLVFIIPSLSTVFSYCRVYIVMLVDYRFEVLSSVKIRIAVVWIAMMHSLVVSSTPLLEPAVVFGKADCVAVGCSCKMLLFIYHTTKTTLYYDTEQCNLVFFSTDEGVIKYVSQNSVFFDKMLLLACNLFRL